MVSDNDRAFDDERFHGFKLHNGLADESLACLAPLIKKLQAIC
jgi:hypothetical protein